MDNSTLPGNEWLVRYLDGELEGAELAAAEQKIAADPALQEELEGLKLAREAVRQYGLRSRVAAIHAEMTARQPATIRRISPARKVFRYGMAVAATIVLAAGIFLAYYFFNLSSDRVYADNYHSFELTTVRGQDNESPVISAFRSGKFAEVISIRKDEGDESGLHLFLSGVSHLQLNDAPSAISDLEKLMKFNKETGPRIFEDEADYYLAMAYIKNRDYDLALPLLEKMRDDERHTYHGEISRKLIRDVKLLKWR